MSKRSLKKFRHRSDQNPNLSFKEKVNRGNLGKQLASGQLSYDQVPWPFRDTMGNDTPDVEVSESLVSEHVHGENCNH